jgi:hypothetical protein
MTCNWCSSLRYSAILLVTLASFGPAQNVQPSTPIDSTIIAGTIESLGAVIKREYIDPDAADQVDAMLQKAFSEGRYATATAETLATMLTRDLYGATHDKHLAVAVARAAPAAPEQTTAQADAARALGVRRANSGVRRVEILPGNVGYLELSAFYRPEEAREALMAAMHLLNRADALIVDMRTNGGGSPGTVSFLMSYMLGESTVALFDIVHRAPEPTDHYATEPVPASDRDGQRPVYVLTAGSTFSGGEGLAFLLQERHRAEVVGETTAGAANPGRSYAVNDRFSVTVPNGRLKSAVSGGNWEGTGVTPDVKTSAMLALPTAYAHALQTLRDRQPLGAWHDTLDRLVKSVEAQLSNR